jgi:intergrase/recombinase
MDFLSFTGLRLNEAVQSFNLIISFSKQNRLNEYYNEANECLEHYKFKEVFIRCTKKAFVSFVPKSLVLKITSCQPLKSKDAVQKRVQEKGLPVGFADVRKAHNMFLTRFLSQAEIDFVCGRVSANVFMSNYFNPKLIGDLKDRVFKAIMEIQSFIESC